MKYVAWLIIAGVGIAAAYSYVKRQKYALNIPLDQVVVKRPTPVPGFAASS